MIFLRVCVLFFIRTFTLSIHRETKTPTEAYITIVLSKQNKRCFYLTVWRTVSKLNQYYHSWLCVFCVLHCRLALSLSLIAIWSQIWQGTRSHEYAQAWCTCDPVLLSDSERSQWLGHLALIEGFFSSITYIYKSPALSSLIKHFNFGVISDWSLKKSALH